MAPPTKSVNQMREDDPKKFLSTVDKGRRIVAFPKKERLTQKVKQSQLDKLIQNLSLLDRKSVV